MRMLADVEAALTDGDHAGAIKSAVAVWDAGFSVPPLLQLQSLCLAAKDGVDAFADALRVLCGADAPSTEASAATAAAPCAADGGNGRAADGSALATTGAAAAGGESDRPRLSLDLHSYVRLLSDILAAPTPGSSATVRLALNLALEPGTAPIAAYPADGDDGSDSEPRAAAAAAVAAAAAAGGAANEVDEQEDGEAAEPEPAEPESESESESESEEAGGEPPGEVFFYGCAAAPELEGR